MEKTTDMRDLALNRYNCEEVLPMPKFLR
jgi:hypothetical protein